MTNIMQINRNHLVPCPLDWQLRGLIQTATGYGKKLTTQYKVNYKQRWRRVYATCFSNVSTMYIIVKGEQIILEAN